MRSPQVSTLPHGLGRGGRDPNKKNLLNYEKPAKAGCVVNTC